jgi:hypothetical protein
MGEDEKKQKYYLVTYRERSGEHESRGKFIVHTSNPDKAIDTVLSRFYFEDTYPVNTPNDGLYGDKTGERTVEKRDVQPITDAEFKVLNDLGVANLLYKERKMKKVKIARTDKPYELQLGDLMVAIERVPYTCGQVKSDCIRKGEVVTIDMIEEKPDGTVTLGFEEHAERYGPWNAESFKLLRQAKP